MLKNTLWIVCLLGFVLAACGGGSQPAAQGGAGGVAENGKTLFNKAALGSAPGCVACHSLEKGKTLVGPAMAGMAAEAANVIKQADYKGPAKTADAYLRESIAEPNVYVTKGFVQGVMPANYGKDLSPQELNDLVAFLMTLK